MHQHSAAAGGGRAFVVEVADLLRRPGTRRAVEVSGPLGDLAVSSAHVVDGSDVEAQVVLEAIGDATVSVTGTVRAGWTGECRRCLRRVDGTIRGPVQEIFEAHPVEGETYRLDGDQLDLEPMVREVVLLALPLAPLCDEGCAGPDPEGHPLQPGEPTPDERWAALRDLRFE